jgi:hypothetical protein
VGFKSTIPGFEREKTVHVLGRAAAVIDCVKSVDRLNETFKKNYWGHNTVTVYKAKSYAFEGGGIGFRFPAGEKKFVFSPHRPNRLWVVPSLLSSGTGVSSPSVKQSEREADNSFSSSTEFKNTWIYATNPKYDSMVQCLNN